MNETAADFPITNSTEQKVPREPIVRMIGGLPFLRLNVSAYLETIKTNEAPDESLEDMEERLFGHVPRRNRERGIKGAWACNNGVYAVRDENGNVLVGAIPGEEILANRGMTREAMHDAIRDQLVEGYGDQTYNLHVPFSDNEGFGKTAMSGFYDYWACKQSPFDQEGVSTALARIEKAFSS